MIGLEMLPPGIWARADDQLADFCLWPYAPLAPTEGKLRSEAVMWAALSLDPHGAELAAIADALVAGLGRGQSVWGLKQAAGRLTWEFYFYDYERLDRAVSLERVLAILRPFAPSTLSLPADRPYFMFSIDFDTVALAARRPIEEVSIYIGNPGSAVSSGLAYRLTRQGLEFSNLYHFFGTAEHEDEIRLKLMTSIHLPHDPVWADRLLEPALRGEVTVVANKRGADGLYHSRVRAPQLLAFIAAHNYPPLLVHFVRSNLDRLDHLYFDLGLDYAMVDGNIVIPKTAIYGLL